MDEADYEREKDRVDRYRKLSSKLKGYQEVKQELAHIDGCLSQEDGELRAVGGVLFDFVNKRVRFADPLEPQGHHHRPGQGGPHVYGRKVCAFDDEEHEALITSFLIWAYERIDAKIQAVEEELNAL